VHRMRKVLVVLLTTFSLILGFAALANAAAKPAYRVTLKTSTTSSVAGKFITVAGKVTGPKAAGKTVTIQRRYVDGGWVSVAFATVKNNGKFSARVETPRGGTTSFRAIKPKSSVRKAGVSATRSTKVFEWLYLANQGATVEFGSVNMPQEVRVGGKSEPRSITAPDGDAVFGYKLGGLCTTLSTVALYDHHGGADPDTMTLSVRRVSTSFVNSQSDVVLSLGIPKTITSSVVGTRSLAFVLTSVDAANLAALATPRVYCNADYLPPTTLEDIK
jgi:hypothetical protein